MPTIRRSKGTGSVRRYKSGWRAELKWTDLPQRLSKTFPRGTKSDAERWIREQIARLEAGESGASGTLSAWIDVWMRSHKSHTAASNWKRDEDTIEAHIRPRIGEWKLSSITGTLVNGWLAELHEAGVQPPERKRAATCLRKILFAHEQFPRSIWDRVKIPQHMPAESRHLTPDELRQLLAAADAKGGWYGAMIRVGVDCGTRLGELLALQWGDYDAEAGTLKIQRSICPKTGTVKTPKTVRSTRKIPLAKSTRAALDALPRGEPTAWIFATLTGRRFYHNHFGKDHWRPLLKSAGLARRGIVTNSLRNTCASLLISAGANILVVGKRLGHVDTNLVLKTYGHLMPEDQQRAADMIEAAIAAR